MKNIIIGRSVNGSCYSMIYIMQLYPSTRRACIKSLYISLCIKINCLEMKDKKKSRKLRIEIHNAILERRFFFLLLLDDDVGGLLVVVVYYGRIHSYVQMLLLLLLLLQFSLNLAIVMLE